MVLACHWINGYAICQMGLSITSWIEVEPRTVDLVTENRTTDNPPTLVDNLYSVEEDCCVEMLSELLTLVWSWAYEYTTEGGDKRKTLLLYYWKIHGVYIHILCMYLCVHVCICAIRVNVSILHNWGVLEYPISTCWTVVQPSLLPMPYFMVEKKLWKI